MLANLLLAGSVILFLVGVVFKALDLVNGWYFMPVSWWRGSVTLALFAISLGVLERAKQS